MNAYVFMHECSNLFLAFVCQKEGRITTKVFKSIGLDRILSRLLKDLVSLWGCYLSPMVMKGGHS